MLNTETETYTRLFYLIHIRRKMNTAHSMMVWIQSFQRVRMYVHLPSSNSVIDGFFPYEISPKPVRIYCAWVRSALSHSIVHDKAAVISVVYVGDHTRRQSSCLVLKTPRRCGSYDFFFHACHCFASFVFCDLTLTVRTAPHSLLSSRQMTRF